MMQTIKKVISLNLSKITALDTSFVIMPKGLSPLKSGQNQFISKLFYPDGSLKAEFVQKGTFLDGLCRVYYPNGFVKAMSQWKDGFLDGPNVLFYPNGTIQCVRFWDKGKEDGLQTNFYPNGLIQAQIPWKHAQKHGVQKFYFPNGQLKSETPISEFREHGVEKTYYPNGILKSTIPYDDNSPSGWTSEYNQDGKLWSRSHYLDGEITEHHIVFPKVPPSIPTADIPLARINPRLWDSIDTNMKRIIEHALASPSKSIPSAIMDIRQKSDLFVFGDIHGALDAFVQNLYMAGLIDQAGHWIGGSKTIVQMGDFVDFGKQSLESYRFLKQLQKEARSKGGNVIITLGNHEFYQLVHHLMEDIFHLKYIITTTHTGKEESISPELLRLLQKDLLTDILEDRIQFAYYQEKDHRWFSHTGISGELESKIKPFLKENGIKFNYSNMAHYLNSTLKGIATQFMAKDCRISLFECTQILKNTIFDISKGVSDHSILWYYGGFLTEFPPSDPSIKQIVGHTAVQALRKSYWQFDQIASQGNVIFSDVGLSTKFGGHQAFVAFHDGKAFQIRNLYSAYIEGEILPLICNNWQLNSM